MFDGRDPAEWLRETWLDLAQVPIAGVQTASWFYQQWIASASTFVGYASNRLTLERPAGDPDVLVADLLRALERFAREAINLPGESSMFFNRQLEQQRRELLSELRPDASQDPVSYLAGEL